MEQSIVVFRPEGCLIFILLLVLTCSLATKFFIVFISELIIWHWVGTSALSHILAAKSSELSSEFSVKLLKKLK